jgi:hypothetical protein
MYQAAVLKSNSKEKQSNHDLVYKVCAVESPQPLPQTVKEIMKHFDGHRTLSTVCKRAQISVETGSVIVKKLTRLGMLQQLSSPQSKVKKSALAFGETMRGLSSLGSKDFSATEEAFFAAELPPIDECNEPFESLSEKINLFFSDLLLRLRGSQVL